MKTRQVISRADLVELGFDHSEPSDKQKQMALLLGYDWTKPVVGKTVIGNGLGETESERHREFIAPKDIRPDPVVFFRPETFRELTPERSSERKPEKTGVSPQWLNKPIQVPDPKRLPMPHDLAAKLATIVSYRQNSRRLDLPRFTQQLARLDVHGKIPRRQISLAPSSIQIIVDRSVRLTPIWDDQTCFVQQLAQVMPDTRIRPYIYVEAEGKLVDPFDHNNDVTLDPSAGPILALTDLGVYGEVSEFWELLGGSVNSKGGIAAALVPSASTVVDQNLVNQWRCAVWEDSARSQVLLPDIVQQLLVFLAPAIRIEPGLLREVRLKLLPESSVDAELLFWNSSALASSHSAAATIAADARTLYRQKFLLLTRSEIGKSKVRDALSIIRKWRANCPDEIWFEEIIDLPEYLRPLLNQQDVEHALAFSKKLSDEMVDSGARDVDFNKLAWLRRTGERVHKDGALSEPKFRDAVTLAYKDTPEQAPLTGPGNGPLIHNPIGTISLFQRGAGIHMSASDRASGSPLAILPSDDGEIECLTFESPAWANRTGTDDYGDWAEIDVGGVVQRLRYMPAGSFVIGSPGDEPGRWDDEGPQSNISFEEGFWLFDTAVTNAVWNAVMDGEHVLVADRDLPKVDVSWDDVQEFFLRLSNAQPHLLLRLPSEAEWEYGCRAGTTMPYFFGTAARREEINFAEGSSGVDSVRSRPPNAWGLFQMHGNIDEWCADVWSDSHEHINSDGSARIILADESMARVVRGGSWGDYARFVRAASRNRYQPGDRVDELGFRCVLGQAESVDRDDRLLKGRESEPRLAKCALHRTELVRISRTKTNRFGIPTVPFTLRTDRAELEFAKITKSDLSWASAVGRDEYGLWARIAINGIEIPFRWIPPGQFIIGSSPEESGYAAMVKEFESYKGCEEPPTQITLARGYWFMDAPVTQQLWKAVMGENPSKFKSPDRPVEGVSWGDVGEFITNLNEELSGASLRLPSESEWEYACRGGSEEETYAGPMQLLGENNAPVLDEIAWYGGNSGIGFELEEGHDSSGWEEKQYDHELAGTRPVRIKRPNNWGCYDLLGNVFEWCEDVWSWSHEGVDQRGAATRGATGSKEEARVVRGGSWFNLAGSVRAAFRDRIAPDDRDGHLGFRCVLGQESSIDRDDRVLEGREAEPSNGGREHLKSGADSAGTTFQSEITQLKNKKG